jgi:DNA-binding XRE family transcriptional regulator
VFIFNTIVGVFIGVNFVGLRMKGWGMTKEKKKKDPILAALAKKVKYRRFMLSLTQEQLAERVGLHTNYIGGIERAQRNPSLISLVALAKGLECSVKDLISE